MIFIIFLLFLTHFNYNPLKIKYLYFYFAYILSFLFTFLKIYDIHPYYSNFYLGDFMSNNQNSADISNNSSSTTKNKKTAENVIKQVNKAIKNEKIDVAGHSDNFERCKAILSGNFSVLFEMADRFARYMQVEMRLHPQDSFSDIYKRSKDLALTGYEQHMTRNNMGTIHEVLATSWKYGIDLARAVGLPVATIVELRSTTANHRVTLQAVQVSKNKVYTRSQISSQNTKD